ncbi:MAG: DUF4347 domain-containing protein [Magnetococcales bacterium]|nr:DUF4347 domain-containing protein [Magnetococcales bacterium]
METQCQWGQPFPVQSIALEPRLMFDAGLAALAMETMAGERVVSTQHIDWIHQGQDPDHQQEIQALLHHWEKPTNAPQTVVFIDSRVPDLNSLLTAIPQGTHVEIIKPGEDGIARITHELQGMKNLESIQIISHGSSGHVLLGNANVDIGSIKAKEASLAQWGKALIPGGDLLLYGCDIAKGLEGQAFIRELAHETGAAVAASTDDTGAKPLGGNWDLEYKVGVVQDHWGLNPLAKDEYTGLLANLLVTSTNDSGAGTLRNTVAAAAAGDTIQFDPNLRNGAGQIAISLTSGAIALPNVTVDGDIAYTGHALDGKADVTIDGSTNNSSIFTIASGATLKSLTLTHGAGTIIGASRLGGDVYITGGTVTITDTSITAGTATFGGGLRVDSATVTLTRCTVSGNAVTAAGTASGGGIYASNSTLTLTDSTVSNNTAKTNGGGIYVSSATANATLTILNSTVTANVAKYSLAGVGNEGGGVLTFAGIGTMTFYIGNSLVKENYLGSIGGTANDINRAGLSYSYGYNMIGKLNLISGASFAVASDLEGTSYNAGLLPLADNGGTTQTHALTSSSQAINKGDPNYSGSLTTDQAGHQRVVGSSIDIGAYELQYIEGLTAGQTVNDNSQLSPFSSVTIPNDGTVTVTITLDDAAKGSFTAASLTASGFTGPVGNAYSLASTTAALAQTAIRALVFTPTSNRVAPGSTETTTLTTVITDGSLTFNDATTTIISTSINDAPTATQTNQSVTFLEDAASVALTPIVVGDVDVSAVITATLTLANPAAGSLTTTGGGSYVSGTGVWSITGTVSQVNTALAALTFIPTANWETNTTLAVNVTDGTLATTGTTSLNVTPVNDAPTATNTTQNITFTENAASVTWTPVVVSDVDTGEVITAQLTLADPAAGVLTTTGGGSYVAGTGVWSVTGSVSTVNTALASVTLVPSSHWTSATSIAINIADGGEDGQLPATGTIAFTVTPLSSSGPTATNTTQTVTYVEDAAQVTWTPIVVTDTDAGATITATVTLADPAAGSLTITGGGSYVAGTGVWSVTGSVSQVNTALAAITFIPTTNWDSNTTLALNVTDGTVAVTGSIALNVTPVNDAPTATNTSQNITFTENSASVTWTPVVVSDVDTGEVITAQLTLADPAAGVLTTTGGGSYVSGTGVWSVTGSVAQVNTALAAVTLVPSTHWTSTTSIAINIADGGENGQLPVTGSISFTVTPLPSSGPTATNTTQTVTYVEDATQVTWTPIVVSDTDAGATITATLTLADPAAGSLTTTGGGSYGVNTGIWSATGSVSQVNTALAAIRFIPTTDWDVNTTLAVNVTDGTVAATGTIALDVTPVNDGPTATHTTQSVTFVENAASVSWTPVVVSDVDTGDFVTAQLTLADPTAGVLTTTGGGSYVSETGVWSVTGSVSQVNTALASVTLVPGTHWTSTTSIAINIADGGENGQLPVTGSISLQATPKDTLTPPTPNQPVDTTPPQKPTDATTPQKPTDATTPQKPTDATTPQTPAPGDTVANQTTPSTSSTSNAVTTIPLATDSVPAPTATRPIVIPQGGDHVTNKDINPITELAHLQTSANDANHQISSPWAPAINGVGSGGGRGMFNTQGGTTETGSGLGSHWDVKDISPSLETLLHVTDNVTKGVMDMGVLVSTMNQAGLSITEQKILLQHLGSSAILDGYNAAGNLDYRQGADVLERLARGETVTQGEWLQVMDKNNLDPKERLSHMLAFQVVQKAQRTEMFAQALVQLDTQEQSNPFERVKPMEEDVTYFKGKFPELTSSKVAILIGINTYPFPVPSLGTAINDISAIGDQLTSSGYQAIELKDAKYDDIVDMFQYLAKKVKPGQDVIIYFAGHGYLREETGIGYWIPSDVDVTSSEKWISTKHISEYLSKISASHIMVISDSCYSGSLTREYTYSTDGDTLSPEEMSKRRAVMALSSGGEEPVMDGGGDGHSVFARHLLSSLAKGNRLRTGFDLFHEVRSEVVKEAPQTPQYGAMISAGHQVGGDYLFTGQ